MNKELNHFLNIKMPSKGYHAHNGRDETFSSKGLSFPCKCGKQHPVNDCAAIIIFPIENKVVYVCPDNNRTLCLVSPKGIFRIKGLKLAASYTADSEEQRLEILQLLESRKRLG